jgi:hypothetical protein
MDYPKNLFKTLFGFVGHVTRSNVQMPIEIYTSKYSIDIYINSSTTLCELKQWRAIENIGDTGSFCFHFRTRFK